MKYLVNFANGSFLESQKLNAKSAIECGGFDKVFSYSMNDIDQEFVLRNRIILSQKRGAGYWLWKPYFILKTLSLINDGDILMYADSGSKFISNIDPIVNLVNNDPNGMICFNLDKCYEYEYTKGDCFVELGVDVNSMRNITHSEQIMSSFHIMRKCPFVVNFYSRMLFMCGKLHAITDMPNILAANLDGYKSHRHDQSIFSLMCKLESISIYPDPTQYCIDPVLRPYVQILDHHRNPS